MRKPTLLLALPLLLACGGGSSHKVVRSLSGSTSRGAFVPPYAYEAYVRGELLLLEGKPAQAVAQLELAVTAPDEDPYLLSRLAYAQLQSGDRAEAARTLAHASELDRCSEAVWLMRGALAESTQELTVARVAYEKASACAPASARGKLALVQLLLKHGEEAAALDLLMNAVDLGTRASASTGGAASSEHPSERGAVAHDRAGPETKQALCRSLQSAAPPALAHALDGLGAQQAADSLTLEQAITLALDRELPRLALRLREKHAARLPAQLEARLLVANGLYEQLAVLVASNDADMFGGHERTAELALEAHAYERAELEATSAMQERENDAMHAVRARALLALGQRRAALLDVRAVQELGLRRALLREALAASGAPALANELAARVPLDEKPNE